MRRLGDRQVPAGGTSCPTPAGQTLSGSTKGISGAEHPWVHLMNPHPRDTQEWPEDMELHPRPTRDNLGPGWLRVMKGHGEQDPACLNCAL